MTESSPEVRVPNRAIYTLTEAARLRCTSIENVMQLAMVGTLQVFSNRPPNVTLFSTNRELAALETDKVLLAITKRNPHIFANIGAVKEPDIQMVLVNPDTCAAIAAQGEGYQQTFRLGIGFNKNSDPVLVEPSPLEVTTPTFGNYDPDFRFSRLFACYPVGVDPNAFQIKQRVAPEVLKITFDMLKVLTKDLSVIESTVGPANDAEFDIGFRPEAYMPVRLIKLHEAAIDHWDFRQSNWKKPRPEEVIAALRKMTDEYGKSVFSGNAAQAAEFVLRETFDHWRQGDHVRRQQHGVVTPFEALVVVASAWRPEGQAYGDTSVAPTKYRVRATALAYLKKCRIPDSYLKGAWAIAAPIDARRSREKVE